ncbi:hypothetical protein [Mycobacterium aquaticum]|uniref:hypothetical protein n=1 Tax=Mycobacterium aquaticum TaxID=1927124 RepID=UPI0011532683|nr:hypothetical protein [Mycobacterium aquaticum]
MRASTKAVTSIALFVALSGCGNDKAPATTDTVTSPLAKTGTPVSPRSETAISAPPVDNTGEPAPRGLLSKESYWNEMFQTVSVSDCIGQGDRKRGVAAADRGWRLPNGALVCASDPTVGVWGDRLINAVVYFEPPTDATTAIATSASLLPSDIQQVGSVEQVNLDWSLFRGSGSCKYLTFESNALAAAVHGAVPDWTGLAERADVKLYSGNVIVPDGSDQMYRADSIHAATISIASSATNPGC